MNGKRKHRKHFAKFLFNGNWYLGRTISYHEKRDTYDIELGYFDHQRLIFENIPSSNVVLE